MALVYSVTKALAVVIQVTFSNTISYPAIIIRSDLGGILYTLAIELAKFWLCMHDRAGSPP